MYQKPLRPVNFLKPKVVPQSITLSQFKILKVLSTGGLLTRNKIADRAGIAGCTLYPMLGSPDPEVTAKAESKEVAGHKTLMSLGYVEPLELDVDGLKEITYKITAKGLNAFSAAENDATLIRKKGD